MKLTGRRWLLIGLGALVVVAVVIGMVRSQTARPDATQVKDHDVSLCNLLAALKPMPRLLGPESSKADHEDVYRILALSEPLGSHLVADYRRVRDLAAAERGRDGGRPTPAQATSIDHITNWLRTCS